MWRCVTVPGNTPAPPPIYSSLLSQEPGVGGWQRWQISAAWWLTLHWAWWLTPHDSLGKMLVILVSLIYVSKYTPVSSTESEGERSVRKWSDRDVTHQSSWAKYLLLFAPCLPSIKYRNASLRQYKQFNHFGKLEASHINQWVISDGETGHAKCRESDKLRKMFLSVLTPSSIKTSRYI